MLDLPLRIGECRFIHLARIAPPSSLGKQGVFDFRDSLVKQSSGLGWCENPVTEQVLGDAVGEQYPEFFVV